MMATDPVNVAGLIEAAGDTPWISMPAGTRMGHVHLHVGDIAKAADFYSEALGFDRTVWHYPGALFMAAGGYHHHLGTNTWAGNAPAPAEEDARLLEWTLEVPDSDSVSAAAENLLQRGYSAERLSGSELVARDPWGTQLRIRTIDSMPRTS
jgi:catechol 2,3-dioxygenase